METTIKLQQNTKSELDNFRQYKNESYNDLVRKILYLLNVCRTQPKMTQKTIMDIEEARKQIKRGEFYTEEEAKKILKIT